ncbi:MAG TPA: outer membrane beta-barrel protein [Thermoanaerobaculia bacterium]|nr:outer membrane beta-barrel protein [Thermoanaerobaculia bacterium]HUM30801.1 outer membrane beta-barrel protein [Thermoanaerobaculia bacterium]HXK69136.1 outer membrane beta-barrel protein [Thermoanaerobaculia bacterium]
MKKLFLLLFALALITPLYAQNNDIFVFGGMYDQSRYDEVGISSHLYDYEGFMTAQDMGYLESKTDAKTGYGLIYTRMLDERLGIEIGYETFSNDLDILSSFSGSFTTPDGGSGSFADSALYKGEIRNYVTELNARYYFTNLEKKFRFYALTGVGLNSIHLDAEATGWIPQNDVVFGTQTFFPVRLKADDFNAFTFNLGAGGDIKLSDKFAITFDLRYFYALNNEAVIYHVMPGRYTDVTGEQVLELGCDSDGVCDNYNTAAMWDSWFDYTIDTKATFYRGVVGIKFMF